MHPALLAPTGFRRGIRVAPTTDSGWETYSDGARLFLPAATNYATNPRSNTVWGATYPITSLETSPPVALPETFTKCTKVAHAGEAYPSFYNMAGATKFAVAAGETYTLSLYVHCSANGGTDYLRVGFVTYNGAAVVRDMPTYVVVTATNSEFIRVSLTMAIAASGEDGLAVKAYMAGAGNTSTMYLTGMCVEKSAVLEPYFDGSYDNCAWTGTADASTSTRTASDLVLTDYVQITSAGVVAAGTKVAYARNPSTGYYGPVVLTDDAKDGDWETAFAAWDTNLNVIYASLVSGDMLLPLKEDGRGWVKR